MVSDTYHHSPGLELLFEALAKAQSEMTTAAKDKQAVIKNDKANYTYRYSDLSSVIEASREPLSKNGLCIVQPVASHENGTVTVTTILGHSSGQWIATDLVMRTGSGTPQAVGTAIAYGRRYALQALICVASEDDDGAEASREPERNQPQQRRQQTTTQQPQQPKPPKYHDEIQTMWTRMNGGKFEALRVFGEMKEYLVQTWGEDEGLAHYRRILNTWGVQKSDEFKGMASAQKCAADMYTQIRDMEAALGPPEREQPQPPDQLGITDADMPESPEEMNNV